MADLHDTIKAVWNDNADQTYQQDQSHWRGVGRWASDAAWQSIGAIAYERCKSLWRILGRDQSTMRNLSVLEWGPGGGLTFSAFGMSLVIIKALISHRRIWRRRAA